MATTTEQKIQYNKQRRQRRKEKGDEVRETERQWKASNIEKVREYGRTQYARTPLSRMANVKKWRKDNPGCRVKEWEIAKSHRPWIKSFSAAKQRCINPKNNSFSRYGGRGIKFLLTHKDFEQLWHRDNAFNMERPSIDRINSTGNYEIGNCRFLEFSENAMRGTLSSSEKRRQ